MKTAGFITDASAYTKSYKGTSIKSDIRNSYDREFEPYDGILNVRKRVDFSGKNLPESIIVRCTALGIFDLYWNGKRVGERIQDRTYFDELKPGWTDYRFRVFEYEYKFEDISDSNMLVAMVSPGWWAGRISFGMYGYKQCAFAAELEIVYPDGKTEILSTADGDWETSFSGPVMRADIWDGEYYDARVPHPAYDSAAVDWHLAVPFDGFDGEIVPKVGPSVRKITSIPGENVGIAVCGEIIKDGSELGAVKIKDTLCGTFKKAVKVGKGEALRFDFGQNIVGRPHFILKAEKGTRIEVFFSEMLNDVGETKSGNDGPRGSLYLRNYRSACSRIVYIASGDGNEEYTPYHTFFGFRYMEIRCDAEFELCFAEAEVISSDMTETGRFNCSTESVNKLFANALWGMRGNYVSVPTDCPQRDERLGWTGDTQVFCGAASYLADIDGFMKKWLGDARDSQIGYNGAYYDIIPRIRTNNLAGAAWADAAVIIPYRLYLMYGDKETLNEHYGSMEAYMKYLEQFGYEGPSDTYGDWLAPADTEKRYISVAYYAYDAHLMTEYSRILGEKGREAYYGDLFERIRDYWQTRYISDGKLKIQTQTAYLLALAFDLFPQQLKAKAVEELRARIVDDGIKLTTGFIGTGMILQTLSQNGCYDLCYDLLMQREYPSWLYSIEQGATTIWERWNSYSRDKGFGDASMNSFNHYAYGAVAEWFFSGIVGIQPDICKPGFDKCVLAPTPDIRKDIPDGQERMHFAAASYDSVKGRIDSEWKIEGDRIVYKFNIPDGIDTRIELLGKREDLSGYVGETFINGNRICFSVPGGEHTYVMHCDL